MYLVAVLYTVQFAPFCLADNVYMLFDMLIASITFILQRFVRHVNSVVSKTDICVSTVQLNDIGV